jgi:hypothetical protein
MGTVLRRRQVKHKTVDNFGTNRDILMIFLWNDDEMVGVAAALSQPRPPNQY